MPLARRNHRRGIFRLAGMLALSGMLASCANLAGPRKVEVPIHKLQAGLERRFPVDNRMLDMLNVRLSRPRLALHADMDRVALGLDASISPPFMRETWSGSLSFSGRLYVDPGRAAVMMADPRIDHLDFGAGSGMAERQIANMANGMIGILARDIPIYTFRLEELRYAGLQFIPTRIETTRRGLLVTLEPQR